MKKSAARVLLSLALVVGFLSSAHAQQMQIGPAFHNGNSTATQDFRNVKGTYFDSLGAFSSAVTSYLALCDDPGTTGAPLFVGSQYRVPTSGVDCGNRQWGASGSYYFGANLPADPCDSPADWSTGSCPPVPQCDGTRTGQTTWSSQSSGDACDDATNCKLVAQGGVSFSGTTMTEYLVTDQECAGAPSVQSPQETPQCISSGGDTWCTESNLADENCGMLNGAYVCLGTVPSGSCTFYGNGDLACASDAGTPPAPDSGTPGVPVTPDLAIDTNIGGTTTTTNIYNSSTVAASAAGATGSNQVGAEPTGETQEVTLDFSEIIEQGGDATGYRGDIDSQTSGTSGELDTYIGGLGDPFGATGTTLGDGVASGLGLDSCGDFTALMPNGHSWGISCAQTANIRTVFAWALRFLFVIGIFHMLTTRPAA